MKAFKKAIIFFILTLSFCSTVAADENTEANAVSGRASDVFNSYTSFINPNYFGGDCVLINRGSGSVQIILQRKDSVNGWWFTYDRQNYTKNFSNTSVCAYSENYTLPAGSTFRCKTNVEATLNGKTDSKTVISPELTVY